MTRPRSSSGSGVSRSEPLAQQIARLYRTDIAAGVLRDGQRMPSTREIAEKSGVSVYTANAAMDILAEEGLVESKPRAGRVVRAPKQSQRNEIQVKRPTAILIGGFAGSGKTELGRILSRETGWAMLDKDTITRPVVEAALELLGQSPHDRESEIYLTKVRPREYECLISAMMENLECGTSVIATAPFIREFGDTAWLNRLQATCDEIKVDLSIVWVYCDAETMHTYVRRRGALRDESKLSNWENYLKFVDLGFRPLLPHKVVDNSISSVNPLQNQARELIASVVRSGGE